MTPDYSFIDSSDISLRRVLEGILCKDPNLWGYAFDDPSDFLGWVDAPQETLDQLSDLTAMVPDLHMEFDQAVLLGFGGISLSARTLIDLYGEISGLEFSYLDSTIPSQIETVERSMNLSRTLFLVSSKSGSTFETMCLFKYFFQKVSTFSDRTNIGDQFLAITDKGSPLDIVAKENEFRMVLHGYPGVGGRYSVFTPFGVFPGLLSGVPVQAVLEGGVSASKATGQNGELVFIEDLLRFLLNGLKRGKDKLFIYTDEGLEGMGLWIEQMLAESLGKSGVGIIPVVRSHTEGSAIERHDSMVMNIRVNKESNWKSGPDEYSMVIDSPFSLGFQLFTWSLITAALGKLMGVNPFDQPHVESSKKAMSVILHSESDDTEISWDEQMKSASDLITSANYRDYIGILCYLPKSDKVLQLTKVLVDRIERETELVCTLHLGPGYLHSVGQLHKGGPENARFLMIGEKFSDESLVLPGETYGFTKILEAQFNGDFLALTSFKKKVTRIRFMEGIENGFLRMFKDLHLNIF